MPATLFFTPVGHVHDRVDPDAALVGRLAHLGDELRIIRRARLDAREAEVAGELEPVLDAQAAGQHAELQGLLQLGSLRRPRRRRARSLAPLHGAAGKGRRRGRRRRGRHRFRQELPSAQSI